MVEVSTSITPQSTPQRDACVCIFAKRKCTPMEWTDLRFFLAAVRGGNLSAAARELGVNYSTVGRRLDALQRGLGATLVQRTPDGLTLTRAGGAVKELCEKIEATALEIERR